MKNNTSSTIASLNAIVSGLKKRQPKGVFLLNGGKYTTQQLITIMQSIVTALLAVTPAKGAYLKAARSADTRLSENGAVLRDLKQSLQMSGGDDTEVIADYGLAPRKPAGPTSPEAKVAGAIAAKATRIARHTMGSKQKAKITGASAAATSAEATTPAVTTSQTQAASPDLNLTPSMPSAAALTSATTPVIPGR